MGIPRARALGDGAQSSAPGASSDPGAKPAKAPLPVGPYTGKVATTDVSILYPLPAGAEPRDFVRPAAFGAHGALLPRSSLATVLDGQSLDNESAAATDGALHVPSRALPRPHPRA